MGVNIKKHKNITKFTDRIRLSKPDIKVNNINLTILTKEDLKANRCSAYEYLIP